jgi:hypothetical protein
MQKESGLIHKIVVACHLQSCFRGIEHSFNSLCPDRLEPIRMMTLDQITLDCELNQVRIQAFQNDLREQIFSGEISSLIIMRTKNCDVFLLNIFYFFRSLYGTDFPILIFTCSQPFARQFPPSGRTIWVDRRRTENLAEAVAGTLNFSSESGLKNGTSAQPLSSICRRSTDKEISRFATITI